MQLLTAPRLVAGGRQLTPGWVLFDELVRELGEGDPPARVRDRVRGGRPTTDPTGRPGADPGTATGAGAGVTELADGVLAPGLVDIQLNGAFGVDFAAAAGDDWTAVAQRLPSTGVTAFVPTLITAPIEDLAAVLRGYGSHRAAIDTTPGAARPLGVHVEGPFLAESRRGAHRADLLRDPAPEDVDALLDAADGALTYLTLAPERRDAVDAIARLTAAGVRVAVGHTDADEPTVRAAADAGATLVTHLYNAQRPMRHRDPGTVGAALTDSRLTCGLIVDLHHVAAAAVQIAFRAAAGRVALVTDAVAAMGMPEGSYELGGERLEVHPGQPPRRTDDTIAGSALRMDEAVANAVRHCDVDLVTAVEAATRVPAAAVGRDDLGVVVPGAPADLVWLDADLSARATWVAGRVVWSREPHLPRGATATTGTTGTAP